MYCNQNQSKQMQNRYSIFYSDELQELLLNNSPIMDADSEIADLVLDLNYTQHKRAPSFPLTSTKAGEILNLNQAQKQHNHQKTRKKHNIQISSAKKFGYQCILSRKNSKSLGLNKFLKSKTIYYLNILQKSKLLTQIQCDIFQKFQKINSTSDQNFKTLFSQQTIKQKCQDFYKSPSFIKGIINSQLKLNRKLQILKNLGKINRINNKKQKKSLKKNQQKKQCINLEEVNENIY